MVVDYLCFGRVRPVIMGLGGRPAWVGDVLMGVGVGVIVFFGEELMIKESELLDETNFLESVDFSCHHGRTISMLVI